MGVYMYILCSDTKGLALVIHVNSIILVSETEPAWLSSTWIVSIVQKVPINDPIQQQYIKIATCMFYTSSLWAMSEGSPPW